MEHKSDNLIRKKIMIAEGNPVSWQKDRVWSLISKETFPQIHRAIYYSTAACIALVIMIGFYKYDMNQKSSAIRISELKTTTDKSLSNVNQESSKKSTVAIEVPRTGGKTKLPAIIFKKRHKKESGQMIKEESLIVTEVKVDQPEIKVEPTVMNLAPTTESIEWRIQPIIGFMPKEEVSVIASKVKKSKIRFFKNHSEGLSSPFQEENKLLTARIN